MVPLPLGLALPLQPGRLSAFLFCLFIELAPLLHQDPLPHKVLPLYRQAIDRMDCILQKRHRISGGSHIGPAVSTKADMHRMDFEQPSLHSVEQYILVGHLRCSSLLAGRVVPVFTLVGQVDLFAPMVCSRETLRMQAIPEQ